MSNLPNIYARCKAGCEWETIHRSEFEALATNIELEPDVRGYYKLEKGKMYEITRNDNTKLVMQVVVRNVVVLEQEMELDTGSHNPTFRLYFSDTSVLDAALNQGKYKYAFSYDVNDKESYSGMDSNTQFIEGVSQLAVSNADKVIEMHSSEITMKNESPNSQETDVGAWKVVNISSGESEYTLTRDSNVILNNASDGITINLNGNKCLLNVTGEVPRTIKFTSLSATGFTIVNQNLCPPLELDSEFDAISANEITITGDCIRNYVSYGYLLVESNDKGIWNVNRVWAGEL